MIDPNFYSPQILQQMDTRLSAAQLVDMFARYPATVLPNGHIRMCPVRLSWPSLGKPSHFQNDPKTPAKYQMTGLIMHKDLGVVVEQLRNKTREFYPSQPDPNVFINKTRDKNNALKDQGLKVSTADGGFDQIGKTTAGYVPGLFYFTAKNDKAVPCFHFLHGQRVQVAAPEEIEREFYAGCWVMPTLSIFKSGSAANPGPVFGLQGVLKIADDKPFSGAASVTADTYADVQGFVDPNMVSDPNAGILQPSPAAADSPFG